MHKPSLLVAAATLLFATQNWGGNPLHCEELSAELEPETSYCGSIRVPEDHRNPAGKNISIAYVVLKALDSSSSAFPVIFVTGGPGGRSLMAGALKHWSEHLIRQRRDVILFDQRGIGYSSALPNMNDEFLALMAADLTVGEELAQTRDLLNKYKGKAQESGIGLDLYNSEQSSADVGQLMHHLGYPKYNLYGVSYGTRLSRLAQTKFPAFDDSFVPDATVGGYAGHPSFPAKLGFFDAFYQAGMNWHDATLPKSDRVFAESDVPSLIIVNQFDPVTPPESGRVFLQGLHQGRLLVLDEAGHGGGDPECQGKVMVAFMDAPNATLDTSCLNLYRE